MRALLASLATAALLIVCGVLGVPQTSGANFTTARTNGASSVSADTPSNYLHLYSQSTDPGGTTGYAVKQNATPAELAATGKDDTLSVELGNRRGGGAVNRVFVVATPPAFPAGVTSVTVALDVTTTSVLSRVVGLDGNHATLATIAAGGGNGTAGGSTTLTLGANQRRQVNFGVPGLLGVGFLYTAEIDVKVTYSGYAGDFLTYAVPLTVYDGRTGGGP